VTEIYRAAEDDPTELSLLAAGGWLRRLIGDVYVPADRDDDLGLRADALARLLPLPLADHEAVAALESAAWLYGGGPAPAELDVYVPPHRSRRRFHGLRVHEGRLDPRDIETVGLLRVTGPARTAADLCRSRPTDVAVGHLDRLHASTRLTPAAVLAVLDRMVRHRGVPHGRDVVQIWAARSAGGLVPPSRTGPDPPCPVPTAPAPVVPLPGPPLPPGVPRAWAGVSRCGVR